MKILSSVLIALTACSLTENGPENRSLAKTANPTLERKAVEQEPSPSAAKGIMIPAKYMKAFLCEFDENPDVSARRLRATPGGHAERARDLTLLRSLGFSREARNFGLDSVGGKIATPAGTKVLGLPVESLEINGMIGDYNALYVTSFTNQISVSQVVAAANLSMDRASFIKYGNRYYSRLIGTSPHAVLKLFDRGNGNAQLTCEINSTPD